MMEGTFGERNVPREKWLYDDRGMKKWMGWILADHSEYMAKEAKLEQFAEPKPQMINEEISKVLDHAWKQNHQITIQLNDLYDNHFQNDVVGWIGGFQNRQIFLADESGEYKHIEVEDIRNVEELTASKWWNGSKR